jgi:DNA-binding IclR family transcriptional regulator
MIITELQTDIINLIAHLSQDWIASSIVASKLDLRRDRARRELNALSVLGYLEKQKNSKGRANYYRIGYITILNN